jgi:hypothetical protein
MTKFTKEDLIEGKNETYDKLKVYLPKSKKTVYINMVHDDWGVYSISYGSEEEITELINLIFKWKKSYDKQRNK